ncbi:DUF2178 domain-containing protein [Halorientalis salina]|uniref:DUF2178 domain-containing protein n=1 Tax=Halorientalis salina TaxID=2932266 RepID=UPI00145EE6DE|nr:DUF2178 domain-containing protein [Halorientalis salina]
MNSLLDRTDRVRQAVAGLSVVAGLGLAVFTALNRPLVGVGVYVVGVAGAVFAQSSAEMPVYDERDEAIAREAAQWTLTVFGWASAGVFPALTVAWGLDAFTWQPWSAAIALFVAILYLTYGAVLVVLQRRR